MCIYEMLDKAAEKSKFLSQYIYYAREINKNEVSRIMYDITCLINASADWINNELQDGKDVDGR